MRLGLYIERVMCKLCKINLEKRGRTSAKNVKHPVSGSLGEYPMNYKPVYSELVRLLSIFVVCLSKRFFRMVYFITREIASKK